MPSVIPYSEAPYPWNVMMELADLSFLEKIFERCLSELKPREQDVIRYRYVDRMTYDEIANKLGITRERVRQITKIALRKLKTPRRFGLINDISDFVESSKEEGLTFFNAVTKSYYERHAYYTETNKNDICPGALDLIHVEDLDLPVRAFNCLKRANCHTVGDVIDCIKALHPHRPNNLFLVRNMGEKTYLDVVKACEKVTEIDLSDYYDPCYEANPVNEEWKKNLDLNNKYAFLLYLMSARGATGEELLFVKRMIEKYAADILNDEEGDSNAN